MILSMNKTFCATRTALRPGCLTLNSSTSKAIPMNKPLYVHILFLHLLLETQAANNVDKGHGTGLQATAQVI